MFAGYAGWSAGQLDGELEQEAWVIAARRPADPFRDGDIWSDALAARAAATGSGHDARRPVAQLKWGIRYISRSAARAAPRRGRVPA